MIGKLKGKIDSVSDDHCIIDVGGVGYFVYCSAKTLGKFAPEEYAVLLIETHVREDHIHLYGFHNKEEKSTFSILQSVKGVGTRMSMAILSHLTPEEIAYALAAQDKTAFNAVSGVGKKLAERIVTELKDSFAPSESYGANIQNIRLAKSPKNTIANDAISALVGLGVSRVDAHNRVNILLSNNPDTQINELIRLALKHGASDA